MTTAAAARSSPNELVLCLCLVSSSREHIGIQNWHQLARIPDELSPAIKFSSLGDRKLLMQDVTIDFGRVVEPESDRYKRAAHLAEHVNSLRPNLSGNRTLLAYHHLPGVHAAPDLTFDPQLALRDDGDPVTNNGEIACEY